MKAMIIQPMAGKTEQEIMGTRNRAISHLESLGYEVENTLFDIDERWLLSTGTKSVPLVYLAESLRVMSRCNAVYLCDGWEEARGCKIEHDAAKAYGLLMIHAINADW